jgi:hypothetical protein
MMLRKAHPNAATYLCDVYKQDQFHHNRKPEYEVRSVTLNNTLRYSIKTAQTACGTNVKYRNSTQVTFTTLTGR